LQKRIHRQRQADKKKERKKTMGEHPPLFPSTRFKKQANGRSQAGEK